MIITAVFFYLVFILMRCTSCLFGLTFLIIFDFFYLLKRKFFSMSSLYLLCWVIRSCFAWFISTYWTEKYYFYTITSCLFGFTFVPDMNLFIWFFKVVYWLLVTSTIFAGCLYSLLSLKTYFCIVYLMKYILTQNPFVARLSTKCYVFKLFSQGESNISIWGY